MQYVNFGNTGMVVSRFCLGAMTLGGKKLDDAESARVVDEALDNGVNFIDTADSYGRSEEVLGGILEGEKREKVYLATKVYMRFIRERRIRRNCRTNIINSLEHSLRLLKTDYIDLYQLHHPDPDTPIEETLSVLDDLVRQGKIRYWGVSNHYAWQMAYMLGLSQGRQQEPLVSYQANYNILDRQIEAEATPFLDLFNVAVMAYSPLCNGILSGKYLGGERPEGSRGAHMKSIMDPYLESDLCMGVVRRLAEMAKEQDMGINQLAILWLMAKPHATSIIIGGSKHEHFRQLYEIADRELDPAIVEEIDEMSAPRVLSTYMNQAQRAGFRLVPQR